MFIFLMMNVGKMLMIGSVTELPLIRFY